jgi:glucuronate isomerase
MVYNKKTKEKNHVGQERRDVPNIGVHAHLHSNNIQAGESFKDIHQHSVQMLMAQNVPY